MKRLLNSVVALSIVLFGFTISYRPADAGAAPKASVKAPTEKAQGGAWKAEWDKDVEAAKKEGKVLIYSTPSGDVIRAVASAFEKKYGIKVEWVNGRGEELTQRMQTEKNAGIRAVDVIMSGSTTTLTVMKPRGLLGKLGSLLVLPEVIDSQAWLNNSMPFVDKDRTTIAMLATPQRYVLRNTNLVQPNEIVSYKDLLKPKWKGRIAMNDPSVAGTANTFFVMLSLEVWGKEETKEFMRQLAKQEPAITRDRRLQVEWVARGKYDLSVATNLENAIEFLNLAAPVAFSKVQEGGMIGAGAGALAVPDTVAHPHASKVFVNWLLSKEGHSTFVKAYSSPGARKDAPREGVPPQMFPEPDEKFYGDTEESVLFGSEMMKTAREIFAIQQKK